MTDERWDELIGQLKDAGVVESEVEETLEDRPGVVIRVIAKTPAGRVCLSRTTQPRKIGEKTFFAKRSSSTAAVENVYDEKDVVHVFTVEREIDGEWSEIRASDFGLG
ncbi:MAG: hypothetical protein WC052_04265 [Patescibacteria group bacterium]